MKRKFILTSLALTFCMGMYAEQPVTVETDSMRRIDLEEVMIHATKTGALLKDLPNRVEVVTKRQIEAMARTAVIMVMLPPIIIV